MIEEVLEMMERIRDFDEQCGDGEYTDTTLAWDLLNDCHDLLEKAAKNIIDQEFSRKKN